jgi:hypothetical protein
MSRPLSIVLYDEDGYVLYLISRRSSESEWYYIVTSSVDDILKNEVCK